VTSPIIQLQGLTSQTSNSVLIFNGETTQKLKIVAYRFPTSSELVVTPERQNTWAGVVYTNQNQSLFAGTAEPTAQSPYTNATWNQPTLLKGKASVTTTNSGNDLGFSVANLPVGNYELKITGLLNATHGASTVAGGFTICAFKLIETTTSTEVARQMHQDQQYGTVVNNETRNFVNSFSGVFNNTSVATRNFRLESQKFQDNTTGNVGNCQAFSAITTNSNNTNITFLLTPLDQPSNSALYVQGPVLGAQTGAAIPASYVGETISATTSVSFAASSTLATFSDITGLSITLTPGVWKIVGKLGITEGCWLSGGALAYASVVIRTGSTTIERQAVGTFGDPTATFYPVRCNQSGASITTIVSPTATTTYKLSVVTSAWSGTPAYTFDVRSDVISSSIFAVRIN
jgi:hypothetical protein